MQNMNKKLPECNMDAYHRPVYVQYDMTNAYPRLYNYFKKKFKLPMYAKNTCIVIKVELQFLNITHEFRKLVSK